MSYADCNVRLLDEYDGTIVRLAMSDNLALCQL